MRLQVPALLTIATLTASAVAFYDDDYELLARDSSYDDTYELAARDADPYLDDTYDLSTRSALYPRVAGCTDNTQTSKAKKAALSADDVTPTITMCNEVLTASGDHAQGGQIVFGWHTEGSVDKVKHFTISLHVPPPSRKGKEPAPQEVKIHVHEDGSWTKGKPGTPEASKGTVKKYSEYKPTGSASTSQGGAKAKKARKRDVEDLGVRELDVLGFYRGHALQAREAYEDAIEVMLGY